MTDSKYSNLASGSGLIVLEPSVQFAGQTSPWVSWGEDVYEDRGRKEEWEVMIYSLRIGML